MQYPLVAGELLVVGWLGCSRGSPHPNAALEAIPVVAHGKGPREASMADYKRAVLPPPLVAGE